MNIVAATLNAKYIHTNLALRYLKASCAPEFDLHIKEFTIKDRIMDIVTELYELKPEVLLFSCYIWNVNQTLEIITLLKKILPQMKVIIGGPEVSYDTEELLQTVPAIDAIIMGEGEITLKKMLHAIENKSEYNEVPGITFLHENKAITTKPAPAVNLKEILSPYRFREDLPNLSRRITYFETSRGCPFNCQFCLSSLDKGVRFFEMEWVKNELLYLIQNGAKTIKFLDRTFNTNKKFALEILQFLIENHLPGNIFQFEITADILPPEIVEFLNAHAPSGLFRFEIGVQSTNPKTNEIIMRKQDFNRTANIVKLIQKGKKIEQHLDLIAGLPMEDYESFKKTFNDVFALRPEELQLGFLKMLRGVGVRKRADEYNYQFMDQPPYEILSNNVLSFEDITKLKQLEDILEKYWNSGRFSRTIEYIVTNLYESPFDFFQEFGNYWHQLKYKKIGHQLSDLFTRLFTYIKTIHPHHDAIILGLMQIDYLEKSSIKPKIWWEKNEKLEFDWTNTFILEREGKKHSIVVELPFCLKTFTSTGTIINQPQLIAAYYQSNQVTFHHQ